MRKLFQKLLPCIILISSGCDNTNSFKQLVHTYKKTYTYANVDNEELKLDYYKPKQIDANGYTIVYVHGGGFSNGRRDSNKIIKLAEDLGKQGYSTVSIAYRQTRKGLGFGCEVPISDKLKAFNEASDDISEAINYLFKNKEAFNIDVNKVVLLGVSAGAEAVLNLIFNEKNSNSTIHINFKAVICKSGALTSLNGLKHKNIFIQLFHGTNDNLVPYKKGSHHNCQKDDPGFLELYGSRAIADELNNLNMPYYLVTLNDGDHAMRGLNYSDSLKEVLFFLNAIKSNRFYESVEKVYELD